MRIYCSSNNFIPANSYVNKVGKYLYNHIDSAYKFKTSSNMYDVYMVVYYQIPYLPDRPGGDITYSDIQEMRIDINITTYLTKLRINLIQMTPDERTLDHFTIDVEKVSDIRMIFSKILDRIQKKLIKMYEGYEFIF